MTASPIAAAMLAPITNTHKTPLILHTRCVREIAKLMDAGLDLREASKRVAHEWRNACHTDDEKINAYAMTVAAVHNILAEAARDHAAAH